MANYKKYNITQYDLIEGAAFEDAERERLIRKIVKLAGKLGWKYSQAYPTGKSFSIEENMQYYPKGEVVEESVTMEFRWKSSKKYASNRRNGS